MVDLKVELKVAQTVEKRVACLDYLKVVNLVDTWADPMVDLMDD
jgi:hypothetical protein